MNASIASMLLGNSAVLDNVLKMIKTEKRDLMKILRRVNDSHQQVNSEMIEECIGFCSRMFELWIKYENMIPDWREKLVALEAMLHVVEQLKPLNLYSKLKIETKVDYTFVHSDSFVHFLLEKAYKALNDACFQVDPITDQEEITTEEDEYETVDQSVKSEDEEAAEEERQQKEMYLGIIDDYLETIMQLDMEHFVDRILKPKLVSDSNFKEHSIITEKYKHFEPKERIPKDILAQKKLVELKQICSKFKLRQSGTANELTKRIEEFYDKKKYPKLYK